MDRAGTTRLTASGAKTAAGERWGLIMAPAILAHTLPPAERWPAPRQRPRGAVLGRVTPGRNRIQGEPQ